jgi:hypothetical protein
MYTVPLEQKAAELEWLNTIKVFPACSTVYRGNKIEAAFGVIVNPETALTIKLRHKLDIQEQYRQR